MYQHLPNHFVPSLFDSRRNQSVPESLLFWTYYMRNASCIELYWFLNGKGFTLMRAWYSSLRRCTHISLSLGPALTVRRGMLLKVFFVFASTIFYGFFLVSSKITSRDKITNGKRFVLNFNLESAKKLTEVTRLHKKRRNLYWTGMNKRNVFEDVFAFNEKALYEKNPPTLHHFRFYFVKLNWNKF